MLSRSIALVLASWFLAGSVASAKPVKKYEGEFARVEQQRFDALKDVDDDKLLLELQRLSASPPANELLPVASASAASRAAGRRALLAAKPVLSELAVGLARDIASTKLAPRERDYRVSLLYRVEAEVTRLAMSAAEITRPEAQVKELLRLIHLKLGKRGRVINAEMLLLEDLCASPAATKAAVLPLVRDKTADADERRLLLRALRSAARPEVQSAVIDVMTGDATRGQLFLMGLGHLRAVGDSTGLQYLEKTLRQLPPDAPERAMVSDAIAEMSARLLAKGP